jgi:hypothetical protein
MNNQTIAQFLKIEEFPFEINDSNGKLIYWEDSSGYWNKCEYDSNGKLICWENSFGIIIDNRPKSILELTIDDIAEKYEVSPERIKIKK